MHAGMIVSFITFCIGLVLSIIAFSSPWWVIRESDLVPGGQIAYGLWRECSRFNEDDDWECHRIGRDFAKEFMSSRDKTVRAMMIMGLIAQCGCAASFAMALVGKLNGLFAGIGSVGASLFTLIAVCVFGTDNDHEVGLAWAYILACVSCGLHFVCGIGGAIVGAISRK